LELKKLVAVLVQFVTAISSAGLDIHFLNRPPERSVSSTAGLQAVFSTAPVGGTPLCGGLAQIFQEYKDLPSEVKLLLVVITDGEPTDGTRTDLFNVLSRKRPNFHVSVAECTDQAEDMEYLDQWDGLILNFDNTDDYREELARVKAVQGMQFKFDYTDYVIKILLATFVRGYFNVDQVKVDGSSMAAASGQGSAPIVMSSPMPAVMYQPPVAAPAVQMVLSPSPPTIIYTPPAAAPPASAPSPVYYAAAAPAYQAPATAPPSGCCTLL